MENGSWMCSLFHLIGSCRSSVALCSDARCPVRTAIDVIFTMTFHIKLYIYIGMNEYYTIYSGLTVISILKSGDITFYGVFFNIIHYWHQSISNSIPCVSLWDVYWYQSISMLWFSLSDLYWFQSISHSKPWISQWDLYWYQSISHSMLWFLLWNIYCYQSISQYVGSAIFTFYVSMPSSYDFQ